MNDEEYYNFVRPYADAMQMLLTRLDVLNHNLYGKSDSRPIHYIQNRIKKKKSLEEKLIRRGKEPTVDNAKDYLQDIAGVRIICYFVDDIYNLAKSLKRQADLIVIREQDYILSLIHISEPTRRTPISYAVFCLKKKKIGVMNASPIDHARTTIEISQEPNTL